MDENDPLSRAAIEIAARDAGSFDPKLVARIVAEKGGAGNLSPAEAVAVCREISPFLFPEPPGPSVAGMSREEYSQAKRRLCRDAELARVGLKPKE